MIASPLSPWNFAKTFGGLKGRYMVTFPSQFVRIEPVDTFMYVICLSVPKNICAVSVNVPSLFWYKRRFPDLSPINSVLSETCQFFL